MSRTEILERERARALPTALATLATVFLFIGSAALKASSGSTGTTQSQYLASFDAGSELASALAQGLGFALLAFPFAYLFRAAASRSEAMREQLISVAYAGPILLGLGAVALWFGFDTAASDFADPQLGLGVPAGEHAEDLIRDQIGILVAQGASFAGGIGAGIILFYTARNALRVGLLTRFTGSLGMAVGVLMILFALSGPAIYGLLSTSLIALFFYLFLINLGMTIGGWRPGGRPPAWEAGTAVPWSSPGRDEDEQDEDPDRPADPDEFAGAIEGSGSELDGSPTDDQDESSTGAPRKRKRRS